MIIKSIPSFKGQYWVTDTGLVFSFKGRNPRLLKTNLAGKQLEYKQVTLYRQGDRRNYYVHELVMLAFEGSRPANHQIDHINRDTFDNTLDNLRYIHQDDHRAISKQSIYERAKITEDEALYIKYLVTTSEITQKTLGKKFGIGHTQVGNIKNNVAWRHLPYPCCCLLGVDN